MRSTILLIVSILIALTVGAELYAQDNLNVERIGEADTHYVAVEDQYAYLA